MKENEKINRRNAKILYNVFKMNYTQIARLYNSTKEAVSRLFRSGIVNKEFDTIDYASEEEIKIIEKMISCGDYSYENQNYKIDLINDLKGEYGFIIKNKRNNINKFIYCEDISSDEKWKNIDEIVKMKRMNDISLEEAEMIEKSMQIKVMNKIRFCPYDYTIFHKYKNIRELNEDSYTKFLGYDNYISKKVENTDEKIIKFFEEHLIDGKVYIPSTEHWIYTYASRQKMSIDEVVSFFGYEKYNNRSRKIKLYQSNKNTDRYIKELLDKIRIEQKNKDKIRHIRENERIIIDRDKNLIRDLKELYSGRCQICRNEIIPIIEQMDGSVYSEAHHIEVLSKYKKMSIEQENEVLDNYKNVIILCPYHHRYVHYNKGGNYKLLKKNNKLYLSNKFDTVEIKEDYHLIDNYIPDKI